MTKKSGRGVVYMVWGTDTKFTQALERSRRALAAVHPELPVEVIRSDGPSSYERLREKPRMLELSPFSETLFLDVDTVVLGRLDFAFDKAARHQVACCICECPWARRYRNAIKGDVIEYNTGVLFFTEQAATLFSRWRELAQTLDSSSSIIQEGQLIGSMPVNDQCAFAAAVDELGFHPFVLPLNWNYRPSWQRSFFGPIRIWHDYDDPPPIYRELAKYYESNEAFVQYAELR